MNRKFIEWLLSANFFLVIYSIIMTSLWLAFESSSSVLYFGGYRQGAESAVTNFALCVYYAKQDETKCRSAVLDVIADDIKRGRMSR